jgi:hypothetical protein
VAVAFDAVAPGATPAAGTTSLSWSHTCVAGATHLLVAAVLDAPNDSGMTMSATYNGVAMTSLGIWHTGGSTAGFLQVWALANPPTGSAFTVSVTSTGSPTQMEGGSLSFTGSGALSAVQATVSSGAQTNPSGNFTGAVSGNIVAGFCGAGSALTQTGSFTNRFNGGNAVNGAGFIAGSTIASSGTVTDSFTMSPADFWAVALVEVQAGISSVVSPLQPGGPTWRGHFNPTHQVHPPVEPGIQQRVYKAEGAPTQPGGLTWRRWFNRPQQMHPSVEPGIQQSVYLPEGAPLQPGGPTWSRRFDRWQQDPGSAVGTTPVSLGDVAAADDQDPSIAADVPVADTAGAVDSIDTQILDNSGAPPQPGGPTWRRFFRRTQIAPVQMDAVLAIGDAAGAVELPAVAADVPAGDVGAAAESPSIAADVPVSDVAGAVDSISIAAISVDGTSQPPQPGGSVWSRWFRRHQQDPGAVNPQVPVADAAAAADAISVAADVQAADVAGAVDSITFQILDNSGAPPQPGGPVWRRWFARKQQDPGSFTGGVPVPLGEAGAAVDSVDGGIAASLVPPDVAGGTEALSLAVSLSQGDAAGASDAISVSVSALDTTGAPPQSGGPVWRRWFARSQQDPGSSTPRLASSGTVLWQAAPYRTRWKATAAIGQRWSEAPPRARWRARPFPAQWSAVPARSRWRARLVNFDPVSALSLSENNILWTSDLAGTVIDPTVAPLTVQHAFPVSSGDITRPTPPSAWFTATWLAGETIKGFVSQCLVGPGGAVTLAAGKYDVHGKILGSPEIPVVFVGVLTVY